MAAVEIASYRIYLHTLPSGLYRTILLYDTGGEYVARAVFRDDWTSGIDIDAKGVYTLKYLWDQFAEVVDLLRNEAPCHLWIYGTEGASLASGPEPVGEAELG